MYMFLIGQQNGKSFKGSLIAECYNQITTIPGGVYDTSISQCIVIAVDLMQ